jgi:transposase-like protein
VLGEDTASMTEKERLDMAVRDATKSLREIAETYDVSPQELSDRFADGNTPTSGAESPNANDEAQEANSGDSVTASGTDEPNATNVDLQKPKSAIEDELQIEAAGPQVPELPSIDDEEDLFK